jgi:PKD repeat protein
LTLISSIVSYSQKITRGPDIGEIYFLGPTNSGTGLYYSTNFGETAVCMDSTIFANSITADKTSGGIYYHDSPVNLYYSNNYGNTNSWEFKNSNISDDINSGIVEGFIYNHIISHSENFGNSFINHTLSGFFGALVSSEIDSQQNKGYCLVYDYSINDTIYLLFTDDNYENLMTVNKFNFMNGEIISLSRGSNSGEVFLFNRNRKKLYCSLDYGEVFSEINTFNFSNYYNLSESGGNVSGEIFILYSFVNLMWQNAHTYIFHSIDYGNTFEVFHPFAKGNEPILANFSTTDKEVHLTESVEFSNFSIGDINEYQWDFENDGIIDSYDEFPTHIYQDTGYYSVKLSVVGQDSTNTFIKENYIHVIDTITITPDLNYKEINIFPNPFNDRISIETRPEYKKIVIYDLNGKNHYVKTIGQGNKTETIDLKKLDKGIYILKIKTNGQDLTKKIIKI